MGVFNGFMVHAHGSLVASAGLTRQPVPGSSWGHWAEHGQGGDTHSFTLVHVFFRMALDL